MLSKLLKYEFKSTYRTYLIVYAVMVALCVLTGTLDRVNALLEERFPVSVWGILMFLTVLFFFAAVVITTVLSINRFYQGLFKSEGYLIHTLPVHSWQILAAKLVPAVVWTIGTGIMMLLSMILMVLTSTAASLNVGIGEFFGALIDLLRSLDWNDVASMLQMCLLCLIGLADLILCVYAGISLGQLFPRHRVAWAVVACFLLSTVQGMSMNFADGLISMAYGSVTLTLPGGTLGWLGMLFYLIWSAVYWAITQLVLSRGLNLE